MKLYFLPILFLITLPVKNLVQSSDPSPSFSQNKTQQPSKPITNETVYRVSKQLCWNCIGEAFQFLFAHNLVRAAKWELALVWDSQLEKYARWWAGQRQADCALRHSFPEYEFKLGENIFWGSGSDWTPSDAVHTWADEERYYTYATNSCAQGQQCGHYTQIVWKTTRRVGCARVVCDSGDVFMTCNYDRNQNWGSRSEYGQGLTP